MVVRARSDEHLRRQLELVPERRDALDVLAQRLERRHHIGDGAGNRVVRRLLTELASDIAFAIDKAFGIKLPLEQWTQEVNEGKASTEQYFVLGNLSARIDELVAAKGT